MDGTDAYFAASNIIKSENVTDISDIIDFDNYYKYIKNEKSFQKHKSAIKSRFFPNRIKELVQRHNFEFETLGKIEIRTID